MQNLKCVKYFNLSEGSYAISNVQKYSTMSEGGIQSLMCGSMLKLL